MIPESRVPRVSPERAELARLVEAPNVPQPICHLVAENDARLRAHVLVARREDDLVGFEFRSIGKLEAVGEDLSDFLALLDFDFAVDDELGGADVDVVACIGC